MKPSEMYPLIIQWLAKIYQDMWSDTGRLFDAVITDPHSSTRTNFLNSLSSPEIETKLKQRQQEALAKLKASGQHVLSTTYIFNPSSKVLKAK